MTDEHARFDEWFARGIWDNNRRAACLAAWNERAGESALLEAVDILKAILHADKRGQGVNYAEAMDRAANFVKGYQP